MNLAEFRQATIILAKQHFPHAQLNFDVRRGVEQSVCIRVDETTFVNIYYSNLTEKKSYALVRNSNRVFGYDNYRI